jgi:predicted enzyme related to lactoylglutathione lyase
VGRLRLGGIHDPPYRASAPGKHTTGAQIGITVDDVDAVHQRAAHFGITVLHMPHDGEWGRNAVYEGPDGNTVSITSPQPRHED